MSPSCRAIAGLLSLLLAWSWAASGAAAPIPVQPSRAGDGSLPPAFVLEEDPLPEGAYARLGSGRLRHADFVWDVAFAPTGKLLASCGSDHRVRLWDVATGRQVRVLSDFEIGAYKVSFSPDGASLAVTTLALRRSRVELRDVATGRRRPDVGDDRDSHSLNHPQVAFSPTGEYLAASQDETEVVLFDARTAKRVCKLGQTGTPSSPQVVSGLAFSGDGKLLASSGINGAICLWDVARQKRAAILRSRDNRVEGVVFTPDGKTLISVGARVQAEDQTISRDQAVIRMWDPRTGKQRKAIEDERLGEYIFSLALAPDGRTLAVGLSGAVQLWDLDRGKLLRTLPAGRGAARDVHSLDFSPDGRLLAGAAGCAVHLWDAATGRLLSPLPEDSAGPVHTLTVSADGRLLASLHKDGNMGLWDLPARRLRRWLPSDGWQPLHMTMSGDGKTVAAVTDREEFYLWDNAAGQKWRTVSDESLSFSTSISRMVLSEDGRLLAALAVDHGARPAAAFLYVWSVSADKLTPWGERQYAGTDEARAVAFSAHDGYLTATRGDGLTRRWKAVKGAFLPDGTPYQQRGFAPRKALAPRIGILPHGSLEAKRACLLQSALTP